MEKAPGPMRITAIVMTRIKSGIGSACDKAGRSEGKSEHAATISARAIARLVNTVRAPSMRAAPPRHMTMGKDHCHEGSLS